MKAIFQNHSVKFILLLVIIILTTIYTQAQNAKLEVDGAVRVGDYTNPPKKGMIRYNSENNTFEGWNGLFWAPLTAYEKLGTVSDGTGNTYQTVFIGEQEWMAENLRTTKYSNGDNILHVTNGGEWANLNVGAWSWYENDSSYDQPHGKLYNWFAVDDSRGLCPPGWRLPSFSDWQNLQAYVGETTSGGEFKEAGTDFWNNPNAGATNASGFTALGSGIRSKQGNFSGFGDFGNWWSSTSDDFIFDAWYFQIFAGIPFSRISATGKEAGMSIRCMRNVDSSNAAAMHTEEEKNNVEAALDSLYERTYPVQEIPTPMPNIQLVSLSVALLLENTPNPFSHTTSITYYVPEVVEEAVMTITDQSGTLIKEVRLQQTGPGRLDIDAAYLPSGTYFYSLLLDGELHDTKQMVIQR